jgi:hypothetical protein
VKRKDNVYEPAEFYDPAVWGNPKVMVAFLLGITVVSMLYNWLL